jgi:hypothetical protein
MHGTSTALDMSMELAIALIVLAVGLMLERSERIVQPMPVRSTDRR